MTKLKTLIAFAGALMGSVASADSLSAQSVQNKVAEESQVSPEVRFVAAGIENARQQLRCAQAVVTRYQYKPKEILALMAGRNSNAIKLPEDQERTTMGQWHIQEARLSVLVQFDREDQQEFRRSQRLVINDRQAEILDEYSDLSQPDRKVHYVGHISSAQDVLRDGLWAHHAEVFDPRFHMYFDQGKPLDQLFLKSNPPAIFKGEEVIEGSRCMKIQIMTFGPGAPKGMPIFYWIDIEHGFMLRRLEDYGPLGDGIEKRVLDREVHVSRLLESNSVWVPGLIESRTFNIFPTSGVLAENNWPLGLSKESFKFEGDTASLPVVLDRITISDFKANCDMPAETFIMKWPAGTSVDDRINQRRFVAQADGSLKEQQHKHEEQKPAEAAKAQPEPGAKP